MNRSSRTIVVGDIHGCIEEFIELIETLDPRSGDAVVLAGDLLDRGPDSAGVVRYARELAGRCRLTLVLGNHEYKHFRFRRHLRVGRPDVAESMDRTSELRRITTALTEPDIAFLESGVLYHRLPEHRALVVHAGISPRLLSLPASASLDLEGMGKHAKMTAIEFLMLRKVDPQGRMRAFGTEQPGDVDWTARYDGRFGTVYYGHQPYPDALEPVVTRHTVGLDLGCCFGGHLAAAVLDHGRNSFEMVKARAVYANRRAVADE